MMNRHAWIDINTNQPDSGQIVIVKMDDGTPEMECYAIAEYDPERPIGNRFTPANVHSSYDGYGVPVLDCPVVKWQNLPDNC